MERKTKKLKPKEAVAKVKRLLDTYYQGIGRVEYEDINLKREMLIESVDEILQNTEIDAKYMILQSLNDEDKEILEMLRSEDEKKQNRKI